MVKKTIHIAGCDKFMPPFIEFVRENFEFSDHSFYLISGIADDQVKLFNNVILSEPGKFTAFKLYLKLIKPMHRSSKIILHGLFNWHIMAMLFLMPWLLKKCYWVMWGGDLYIYDAPVKDWRWKKNEFFKRFIAKRMGHFITYIKGDYELAQKWYGAKGEYHHCFMYPSNLYKEYILPPKQGEKINILVGNSAAPSNNHAEIFEKLTNYKQENILIFCPLSYGPATNAERIAKLGKEIFGDRFIPLLDFMPFENYLEMLGNIDIAMFAHNRQQAMGNTITLLGLGKKVFMRTDVTQWSMFETLGVKVFSLDEFSLGPTDIGPLRNNKIKIKENFSERQLIEQYKKIFE